MRIHVQFLLASAVLLSYSTVDAQTILRFAHTDQEGGAREAAAQFFGSKVEQLTKSRYKVQVFCCSKLGNDPKNIEQLASGSVDFTVSGTGSYAPYVPTLNLSMLPFLVDNYAQGWKLYDESRWMKEQFAKAPAKGFRILATWEAGFRNMTTTEPLVTPTDAKGKTLRTFPNEMMRWTLEAMGFDVQIIPFSEVYKAIQKGTVGGQENPVDTIFANKFYEVAPYVTLTNHVYSPLPLAISEKTWAKMSPEDQSAVTEAARRTAQFSRIYVVGNEDTQIKAMEKLGAHVQHAPNVAAFRTSVQPAYAKARETYGVEVDRLLEDARNIRKRVRN